MEITRWNRIISSIVLALISISTIAMVKLPAIVSSNMVLQRSDTVVLWGWADAGEKLVIDASWLANSVDVEVDERGEWRLEVTTTDSKEVQKISIKGDDSEILLDNILFGEVWLCSGQSNMEQSVQGYPGQPTFGFQQALIEANNSQLRLFTVQRNASKTPLANIKEYNSWQEAGPDNVIDFSAVAYYFGKQLQRVLDVPVGMIHTSWGGSSIEAWMSKESILPFKEVDLENVNMSVSTNHIPTALYNAMVAPLIPYGIKGVLWYQGESNRKRNNEYEQLLPAMVQDWRSRWNSGDFPFYFVQIAPYSYNNNEAYNTVDNSAFMRESQMRCVDLISNSGIAITLDIGDELCIHPPRKKEVADRLLYNALNQSYGLSVFDGKSPAYASMSIEDTAIVVSFKNAESGLFTYRELQDFEIAGEDKVFYPAKAEIVKRKSKVKVYSELVPQPLAVRYAWRNFVEGTLFDANELPASSFRTDAWVDATRAVEK